MVSPRHILPLLLALAAIPVGARTYCCNDEHGRRVCGDILPEQCQKRSYNEYNSQGVLSKQYPGPLTPEQRAQLEAENARKKIAEHEAAEQARRDRALLASYSSVADIDAKRVRTITVAQGNLHNAEERLSNAEERRERFRHAAERYGDKPMPEVLKTNIRVSEAEYAAAQAAVSQRKKDIIDSQKQFDEDRRRYTELTAKSHETPSEPTTAR